ncbi:UvrD-helicase domain-containing protein [Emcibacter sp. SYSU 3D8]|uniref:ATP-dependent helicase n=1 Tax=Emcibacter sp. SYSU 3D8 TaxID=3133969 RepID=UPI0031FE9A0A
MSDPFDLDDFPVEPEPANRPGFGAEPPYLRGLNEPQRLAVTTLDGPVLLLAGAGTGKTTALTTRLAHIINSGKAWPGQVLAVTFTNRASREMQHRVAELIGQAVEGMPWLGTFHAVAARILRRHAELVGLRSNFTILDTDDQIRLIKQLLQAENIDDKRWPARVFASLVDGWKNRALGPDKIPNEDIYSFDGKGGLLYRQYQERLKTLNACDFGDLLLHNVTIFTQHPDVLGDYHRRFKYILVDEYQDTNVAQYLWLRLLAQKHHNICCVGDDDQSIYGWRGAEVGNILRFEKDFPGARIIRLEQNYRSTPHILGAASGLIAANAGRLGKTLWTEVDSGEKVKVTGVWDSEEEARTVGDTIEDLHRKGMHYNHMAVLVRAGFQTREFEERFMTIGVPYRVLGGLKFYERQEIRDALAYLRVVYQPDDDLAFERIVNVPKRGLGDVTIRAIHDLQRAQGVPMIVAAGMLAESEDQRAKARAALRDLVENFARWRKLLDSIPHVELAEMILDESGYTEMWQRDRSFEAPGRLDNLQELVRAMEPFENMGGYLEHVSLATSVDEMADDDKVNVMTLHAAKGLEFRAVFLPGWEEGLFPSQRTLDESGNAGLEEERRLAYVGITRARERAFISAAANRRIYNQYQSSLPSRFIEELPETHVERDAAPGLYQGNRFDYQGYNAYGGGVSRSSGMGASGAGGGFSGGGDYRSLGERRAASQRAQTTIIAKADKIMVSETAPSHFAVGERVFHQKFGYGSVIDVEGNKLEIEFEKAGIKRVLDSFVEPAP